MRISVHDYMDQHHSMHACMLLCLSILTYPLNKFVLYCTLFLVAIYHQSYSLYHRLATYVFLNIIHMHLYRHLYRKMMQKAKCMKKSAFEFC